MKDLDLETGVVFVYHGIAEPSLYVCLSYHVTETIQYYLLMNSAGKISLHHWDTVRRFLQKVD